MKAIWRYLQRETWWPVIALLIGAAVLLPQLGNHGFWEPDEIRIADDARERLRADDDDDDETDDDDLALDIVHPLSAENRAKLEAQQKKQEPPPTGPPFTEWIVSQGIDHLGVHERGARTPLALLGLLALLVAFFLGKRLASARAGLIAALVLLSFPMFLTQTRQLMSDIGAVVGSGLVVLGLVGLAQPPAGEKNNPIWQYALDVAMVAVGAVVSYYAAAALLGLVVPFGAVALACLASLAVRERRVGADAIAVADPGARSRRQDAIVIVAIGALVAALIAAIVLDLAGASRERSTAVSLALIAVGVAAFLLGLRPAPARPPMTPVHRWHRAHLWAAGLIAVAVAAVSLGVFFAAAFDLKDPVPGERALLGYSLIPTGEYADAVGGAWRINDDLSANFNSLFEQLAFGLFPWGVLIPIALVHLASAPRGARRAFAGYALLAWALLAWVVATMMTRKVGPVRFPALIAMATAVGLWVDELLSARDQADATAATDVESRRHLGIPLHLPLVGLFAVAAAIVIGKDIYSSPDRVLAVSAVGKTIAFPKGLGAYKVTLQVLGALVGLSLLLGLWLWRRRRPAGAHSWLGSEIVYACGRYGVFAAVAIGVAMAAFVSQGWIPKLSERLSSKRVFSVYHQHRDPGDVLGIMGRPGSGPDYYADGPYEELAGRPALLTFLRRPERVFALIPTSNSELCAIHRAIKGQIPYAVLYDKNERFLLLSNRLESGERDRNPLTRAIVREPPTDQIKTPLKINYDNKVELIGVDMPTKVSRGDNFEMTLFYKVLRPVGGSWKVFVHLDRGSTKINGDHKPINDLCSTSFWQAGDYIIDHFQVNAGDFGSPTGDYNVYTGFFQGSHGNWRNMPIASGDKDSSDRAPIGKIRVQ